MNLAVQMMQISQFSADPGQETFLAVNPPQLDDFCRICLLRKPTLHPLTSQPTPVMIPEMLFKITGTMVNMQEPMPRVICDRCLLKLDLAYNIAEEFRKQEETLRRFWWKGGLVEQLVEYEGMEESRRKLYSEEVLERLAGERVGPSDLADLEEEYLPVQEVEPIDATEFTIKVLSDEAFDELADELLSPEPDEGVNEFTGNGLEMVLELVDLRTIGALPAEVEEQLLKQEVLDVVDYVPSPEDFGAQIDLYEAFEEESDNVDDDERDEDFDPRQSRVSSRNARSNKSRYVEDTSDSDDGEIDGVELGDAQNVCDVDFSAKVTIKSKDYWFQKGSFKCPECSETFRTRFSLRRHYRRHVIVQNGNVQSDVPVEPATAPEPCTEENNLEDFMCKYCKRLFQYRSALIKHVLQHERWLADKGPESQGKEQEIRENRQKIRLPIKVVVNDETHYKCRECGITFDSQTGFWQHARQHAPYKTGQFQCPDCWKRFPQRKKLRQHQLTAHNLFIVEEQPDLEQTKYHCTKCDTFFSTGRHFLIHERGHLDTTSGGTSTPTNESELTNEDGQSTWVCVDCDSNFNSSRSYMDHQRRHKNLVNVRFKCEICKMAFDKNYPLMKHYEEKHRISHIPPNMKECYICEKKVKKSIFGDHIKKHEYKEMRKYVCQVCDMAFGSKSHLKAHEVRKSCQKGKERAKQSELPQSGTFKCDECQGTYISQKSFVKHMKRHQNIKEGKYRCEPCVKIFSSKFDLDLHVRRRHV